MPCSWWTKKEDKIGKIHRDKQKTIKILILATIPKFIKLIVLVKANVRNPIAVVKFVRKVAVPIFWITKDRAFTLFPCSFIS